ncbi:M28 family peptidase [Gemmatimonadota bacterium]
MSKRTRGAISGALFFLALAWPSLGQIHAQDATASITASEIREHIFFLASDELGGRNTGEEGYLTAASYAAAQFLADGVAPGAVDAAGAPSFLQEIPFRRLSYGVGNAASLGHSGGTLSLEFGADYFVMANRPGERVAVGGPMVFAGYGMVSADQAWDDLAGLDLAGSVPVVMFGRPGPDLTSAFPTEGRVDVWGEFQRKVLALEERGAVAVVAVLEPRNLGRWEMYSQNFSAPQLIQPGRSASSRFPDTNIPVLFLGPTALEELFTGKGFNPASGEGEYSTFPLEGSRLEALVQTQLEPVRAPNVVGMVEGTDPVLKNEYIVVGAHLDHVGIRNGEVYNGADDNASGSVGVMEIAEAVALAPPKRSCIFVLYTGEERGILGSGYFVANPPVPLDRIIANINIEMIGRYDHRPLGTGGLFAIIGSSDDGGLRERVAVVNGRGFDYEWEIPEEFMGGSDHTAFHREGIPNITVAASPPYGTHPDYHQPGDEAEKIDIGAMRKAVAFIFELTLELANVGPGRSPSAPR